MNNLFARAVSVYKGKANLHKIFPKASRWLLSPRLDDFSYYWSTTSWRYLL